MDRESLDKKTTEIAFKISEKLHFQSMNYNFIYDENQNPVFR